MEVVRYQRVQSILFYSQDICVITDLGDLGEINGIVNPRFIFWKMMELDKRNISASSHTIYTIFTWRVY